MSNTIPLAKAEAGLKAVFDVAGKDGKPPIALAVVDRHGDLICFARMGRSWRRYCSAPASTCCAT